MDGDERLPPLEDLPAGAYGGYELEGRMARPGEDDAYSESEAQIMPQEDMLDRMDEIRRLERLESNGAARRRWWRRRQANQMAAMNQMNAMPPAYPMNPMAPRGVPGEKLPSQYPVSAPSRADRYVIFAFWVIEIALFIRVILRLMAGNPEAMFTTLVYGLTWPFVAFFADVFPSPSGRGHALDAPALLALFIYPLVTWGIVRLIELHHYRNRRTT